MNTTGQSDARHEDKYAELRRLSKQVEARFPDDPNVDKLLGYARELGVHFLPSEVREQWLYHPRERIITVWLADLAAGNNDFIVVMLAHELGHVLDFDLHPEHIESLGNRHWSDVPQDIERSAFLTGFRILLSQGISARPEVYAAYIEGLPTADLVRDLLAIRHQVLREQGDSATSA